MNWTSKRHSIDIILNNGSDLIVLSILYVIVGMSRYHLLLLHRQLLLLLLQLMITLSVKILYKFITGIILIDIFIFNCIDSDWTIIIPRRNIFMQQPWTITIPLLLLVVARSNELTISCVIFYRIIWTVQMAIVRGLLELWLSHLLTLSYSFTDSRWWFGCFAIVQSLFYHSYSFLLMTNSSKATESHIFRPIKTSVVLRVLHTVWPIVLTFQILGDLTSCWLISFNGSILFILQDWVV